MLDPEDRGRMVLAVISVLGLAVIAVAAAIAYLLFTTPRM